MDELEVKSKEMKTVAILLVVVCIFSAITGAVTMKLIDRDYVNFIVDKYEEKISNCHCPNGHIVYYNLTTPDNSTLNQTGVE